MDQSTNNASVSHHTPGPWHCDPTVYFIESASPAHIARMNVFSPEHEANARLIAAAPELLASAKEAYENSAFHQSDCKGVSEYVEGDIFDNTVGCDCYLSRLKAAIDRAEGRES